MLMLVVATAEHLALAQRCILRRPIYHAQPGTHSLLMLLRTLSYIAPCAACVSPAAAAAGVWVAVLEQRSCHLQHRRYIGLSSALAHDSHTTQRTQVLQLGAGLVSVSDAQAPTW